jgi:hypothetical protein
VSGEKINGRLNGHGAQPESNAQADGIAEANSQHNGDAPTNGARTNGHQNGNDSRSDLLTIDDPELKESFSIGYRYGLWKLKQEQIEDDGGPNSIYPPGLPVGGAVYQDPAVFKADFDALRVPEGFDLSLLPPLPKSGD